MWMQLISSIFGVVFKELFSFFTQEEIIEYKEATDEEITYDTDSIINDYAWFDKEST